MPVTTSEASCADAGLEISKTIKIKTVCCFIFRFVGKCLFLFLTIQQFMAKIRKSRKTLLVNKAKPGNLLLPASTYLFELQLTNY